jgi:hypothetical protein
MSPSRNLALGTLVLSLLGTAGLVWLLARGSGSGGPTGLHRDTTASLDPRPAANVLAIDESTEPIRRAVQSAPSGAPPGDREATRLPVSSRGLVLVQGQVRRRGRPLAGYDLAFHAWGEELARNEADWDFTDDEGRYQVRLPAARYLVRNEDEERWLGTLIVPGDQDRLTVDLDLPPAR